MFKRGEVVQGKHSKCPMLRVSKTKGIWLRHSSQVVSVDSKWSEFERYTGPVYEVDGQGFVPDGGPCRLPKDSEWYYSEASKMPKKAKHDWKFVVTPDSGGHRWTRRILLPVPDLPEEPKFQVGDRVRYEGPNDHKHCTFKVGSLSGEGWPVADCGFQIFNPDLCTKLPDLHEEPRPEFQVGDWLRKQDGEVYQMHEYQYPLKSDTKLPGRPLTTDDLMQVLGGKRITVECHACGCEGVRDVITYMQNPGGCKEILFYHGDHSIEGNYHLAAFQGGRIVFADVEGNIFVIEEGS